METKTEKMPINTEVSGKNVPEQDEKPPVLGSWKNLYALVIGNLIFLVVLFYLFTRYFS